MLRVTAWTLGLFGAGASLAREISLPWLEPVVLLALGIAFLVVSARSGVPLARAARAREPAPAPRGLAAQRPAPAAAAPVVVEQSV